MNWESKKKLNDCLGEGKYLEAVQLMENEPRWDDDDVEIFLHGFDIRNADLCKPIEKRLAKYNSGKLGWSSIFRMETLMYQLQKEERR